MKEESEKLERERKRKEAEKKAKASEKKEDQEDQNKPNKRREREREKGKDGGKDAAVCEDTSESEGENHRRSLDRMDCSEQMGSPVNENILQ